MPQGTICRNKGYVSGFTKLLQEGDAFLKCCSCENLNFRCSSFHILYCYSFKLLLVLALFWKKKNWLDFISPLEYIKYMIYACHILAMDYTYSERSCVWRRRTTENLGSNLPAWYLPVGGTPLRYSIYHLLNVKS